MNRSRRRSVFGRILPAAALISLASATALGQLPRDPDAPDLTIDSAGREEVIRNVLDALEARYVFPETAARMRGAITARREAGEYDDVGSAKEFAQLLTDHLQQVSKDKHLHIEYSHETLPPRPEGEPQGPSPEERARMVEFARRVNYGFERVERLEANVGYLKLRGFVDPAEAGETTAAAMTFLANTDALIVDLRENGGGDPGQVAQITSYLFGSEPVHLNDLYFRPDDSTRQYWTSAHVPGKRLGPDKPVYVLTSSRTFSAAEEFTYNLKNLKRATIVGEITGGGAHPGGFERLSDHFGAFIPAGRAINPITRTNWEGTGVEPDVTVSVADALSTAHVAAIEALIEKAEEGSVMRDQLRKALERVKSEADDTGR